MKKAYIYAGISCFCWGTLAPVSKILFSDMSNMAVLGYGSAIGAITLFFLLIMKGEWKEFKTYSWKTILQLIALGSMGYFLYSALYYQGLSVLPAQTACILNYLWPLFTVFLSIPVLGEKISASKIIALCLSFFGVAIIVISQSAKGAVEESKVSGYICCLIAAFLYGLFNVLNKKQGENQTINMFFYIGAGAVWALIAHVIEGPMLPGGQQWIGLLWMGIFVNGIAYLFWAIALQGANTASVSNLAYTTPVISLILSAFLLRERIYISSLLGLVFIIGGILLQTYLSKKQK